VRTFAQHIRADLARHSRGFFSMSAWPVLVYRFGVWSLSLSRVPRFVTSKLYGIFLFSLDLFCATSIPRETTIGEDLLLPHVGSIKIHPDCVIGDRCCLFHEVTLGLSIDKEGAPTLGNDVFVGPGAKILGPVRIGDGARIAANSLVITDIPAGANAIGVPARAFPAPRTPTPKARTIAPVP